MAEPTRVPGRNGGELLRHPPGSNGGTHRGPDLKPRLFVPSLLLKAFTDEGELALPPASEGSGAAKRKRARALHAAIHNAATLVQRVMRDAAEGDDAATGHAIRLLALTHETLQPTKHEAAKGGQGPILPKFNRPTQSAPPAPPSSSVPAVEESQASMATLRLFDANTTRLLPRVPCYFDDIIGFSTGDCNGERLAISDFNTAHPIRKLSPIFGLRHFVMPPYREQPWVEMMYLTHLFDHPMYGLYDGFLRRDGSDGRPSAHLPAVRRPPRDHLAASA